MLLWLVVLGGIGPVRAGGCRDIVVALVVFWPVGERALAQYFGVHPQELDALPFAPAVDLSAVEPG